MALLPELVGADNPSFEGGGVDATAVESSGTLWGMTGAGPRREGPSRCDMEDLLDVDGVWTGVCDGVARDDEGVEVETPFGYGVV